MYYMPNQLMPKLPHQLADKLLKSSLIDTSMHFVYNNNNWQTYGTNSNTINEHQLNNNQLNR